MEFWNGKTDRVRDLDKLIDFLIFPNCAIEYMTIAHSYYSVPVGIEILNTNGSFVHRVPVKIQKQTRLGLTLEKCSGEFIILLMCTDLTSQQKKLVIIS
jgi:hypothetical protein